MHLGGVLDELVLEDHPHARGDTGADEGHEGGEEGEEGDGDGDKARVDGEGAEEDGEEGGEGGGEEEDEHCFGGGADDVEVLRDAWGEVDWIKGVSHRSGGGEEPR